MKAGKQGQSPAWIAGRVLLHSLLEWWNQSKVIGQSCQEPFFSKHSPGVSLVRIRVPAESLQLCHIYYSLLAPQRRGLCRNSNSLCHAGRSKSSGMGNLRLKVFRRKSVKNESSEHIAKQCRDGRGNLSNWGQCVHSGVF